MSPNMKNFFGNIIRPKNPEANSREQEIKRNFGMLLESKDLKDLGVVTKEEWEVEEKNLKTDLFLREKGNFIDTKFDIKKLLQADIDVDYVRYSNKDKDKKKIFFLAGTKISVGKILEHDYLLKEYPEEFNDFSKKLIAKNYSLDYILRAYGDNPEEFKSIQELVIKKYPYEIYSSFGYLENGRGARLFYGHFESCVDYICKNPKKFCDLQRYLKLCGPGDDKQKDKLWKLIKKNNPKDVLGILSTFKYSSTFDYRVEEFGLEYLTKNIKQYTADELRNLAKSYPKIFEVVEQKRPQDLLAISFPEAEDKKNKYGGSYEVYQEGYYRIAINQNLKKTNFKSKKENFNCSSYFLDDLLKNFYKKSSHSEEDFTDLIKILDEFYNRHPRQIIKFVAPYADQPEIAPYYQKGVDDYFDEFVADKNLQAKIAKAKNDKYDNYDYFKSSEVVKDIIDSPSSYRAPEALQLISKIYGSDQPNYRLKLTNKFTAEQIISESKNDPSLFKYFLNNIGSCEGYDSYNNFSEYNWRKEIDARQHLKTICQVLEKEYFENGQAKNTPIDSSIQKNIEDYFISRSDPEDVAFFYGYLYGPSLKSLKAHGGKDVYVRKLLSDYESAQYFKKDSELTDENRVDLINCAFHYWCDIKNEDCQKLFNNSPEAITIFMDYMHQDRSFSKNGDGDYFANKFIATQNNLDQLKLIATGEVNDGLGGAADRDYPNKNEILSFSNQQELEINPTKIFPEFILDFKDNRVIIDKLAIFNKFCESGNRNVEQNKYPKETLDIYIQKLQDYLDQQNLNTIINLLEKKIEVQGKIVLKNLNLDIASKKIFFNKFPSLFKFYLETLEFSKGDDALLSDPEFGPTIYKAINELIQQRGFRSIIEKIKDSTISQELVKYPEFIESCKNYLLDNLAQNSTRGIDDMEDLKIKDELMAVPEVIFAAEQCIVNLLNSGTSNIKLILEVINKYKLSQNFILSEVVQTSAKNSLNLCLSDERYQRSADVQDILNLRQQFEFSDELLESSGAKLAAEGFIKNRLVMSVAYDKLSHCQKLSENFNLDKDFWETPEIEEAVKTGIVNDLSKKTINFLQNIINSSRFSKFKSPKFLQEFAKDTYFKSLLDKKDLQANEIRSLRSGRDLLGLNTNDFEEILKIAMATNNHQGISTLGEIINNDERKLFADRYGDDVKNLLWLKYINSPIINSDFSNQGETAEFKDELSALGEEFSQGLITTVKGPSNQALRVKNLTKILVSLNKHQSDDEQAIQRLLQEVALELPIDNKYLPRLLKTLCELRDDKSKSLALKISGRREIPEKLFIYVIKKLVKTDYLPRETSNYLTAKELNINNQVASHQMPDSENIQVLKEFINKAPNQFTNIIKAANAITNFKLEPNKDVVFKAINDLGSITPEIFKHYYLASDVDRKLLVEKINNLKPKLFKNEPIDNIVKTEDDRRLLTELTYIAYRPIGMGFTEVNNLINQLKDHSEDLKDYKFPEEGYVFSLKTKSYSLKEGEKIEYPKLENYRNLLVNNPEDKVKNQMAISKLLNRLAKASTDFKEEEINQLLSLMSPDERLEQFTKKFPEVNDKNCFYYLNDLKEILGIYYKDNYNQKLENFLESDINLKERLVKMLMENNQERLKTLKRKLEDDSSIPVELTNSDLSQLLSKFLSDKVLKNVKQDINKNLKKFGASKNAGAALEANDLKAYISKNVGSFFAKASAGICTANDVTLFNRPDHFHINIVEGNEKVRGNIQAYIIPEDDGFSLTLRGFNPNSDFLDKSNIDVKDFSEKVLEIGRQFIKDNNLKKLYVTDQTSWHALSNRASVAAYLKKYLKSENNKKYQLEVKTGHFISDIFEIKNN